MSGNGPLVEVLREALKKSVADKNINKRETEAAINALIQSSYSFKLDNVKHNEPTAENILILTKRKGCGMWKKCVGNMMIPQWR